MVFREATFSGTVQLLLLLVQRAGGLAGIRTGERFTSTSSGRDVWLTVGGQQSGDLTCLAPNARPIDRQVARATLRLEQRVVRMSIAKAVLR